MDVKVVGHDGADGNLNPILERAGHGAREKPLDTLPLVVEQGDGNEGCVVFERLSADKRTKNVGMIRVDYDRFGIEDHPAAVGLESQALAFAAMSALAVDGSLDVTGKVASFAADPAVRQLVEIAILRGFEAVVEDLDGARQRGLRRRRFSWQIRWSGAVPRLAWWRWPHCCRRQRRQRRLPSKGGEPW